MNNFAHTLVIVHIGLRCVRVCPPWGAGSRDSSLGPLQGGNARGERFDDEAAFTSVAELCGKRPYVDGFRHSPKSCQDAELSQRADHPSIASFGPVSRPDTLPR